MAYQVAKDVVSYCTSCRRDLMHIIVAMDGEKIVRVLCGSCKKEHAFHPPKEGAGSKAKKTKSRAPVRKKEARKSAEWEQAVNRHQDRPALPYAMTGTFEAGDKIDHRTFGTGFVLKIMKPDKMEVLFEQGTKILVWGKDR